MITEEEDRVLEASYDKHGAVWATTIKDPMLQEQNHGYTDLRDRIPDLYQAARYRLRNSAEKKLSVAAPTNTSMRRMRQALPTASDATSLYAEEQKAFPETQQL